MDVSIDRSRMIDIILDFPKQIVDALKISENIDIPNLSGSIDNIVYCGMGGSAIAGDFIKNLLRKEISIPIEIVRDYAIPKYLSNRSLTILVSYSGNTEETLSCLEQAIESGSHLLGISSGGKLMNIFDSISGSSGRTITFVKIPAGYPPRTAFGYLSIPLLIAIYKSGLISRNYYQDLNNCRNQMEGVRNNISPDNIPNYAYDIATDLFDYIPIIYGSADSTDFIARRWSTQFSENSKVLSFYNSIPEMNHNEIVGWSNLPKLLKSFVVVFLHDEDDHKMVTARQEITEKLLKGEREGETRPAKILNIHSEGNDLLSRWLYLIYLGDFISWYLAILYNTDPTPVKRIDTLKEALQRYRS